MYYYMYKSKININFCGLKIQYLYLVQIQNHYKQGKVCYFSNFIADFSCQGSTWRPFLIPRKSSTFALEKSQE